MLHASYRAAIYYVRNYLIFSILVFSFTNSLLEVFKQLHWLVSQGRVPFSLFVPLHGAWTTLSRHGA